MAKYLITGGAGFIGSNYLLQNVIKHPENQYVCLDALTYASNISYLKPLMDKGNFKFVKGNICNLKLVDALFKEEQFDIVINFAAESHVDNSILNPSIFLKTNVIGTQVLLNASLKYKVKRFHQVSTDEVYGSSKDYAFKEDDTLNPSSAYSASKASADLLVLAYYKTYNLPVSISRCSNNYGLNQHKEKLIPKVIYNAKHNKKIPVYGTGNNLRDWIYVLDHCDAIDLIIDKGKEGNIYNIKGNKEITNIELIKFILKTLNKNENLIEFVDDRLGHDFRYLIDDCKIQELGFKHANDFEEKLIELIKM